MRNTMKCKVCGGTGTSNTCVNGTFKPCTFCDGTGEYEPFDADVELDKLYPPEQTNEEYMQTCSSDELANTIFRLIVHGTVIRPDREYIKKWLKEKHE